MADSEFRFENPFKVDLSWRPKWKPRRSKPRGASSLPSSSSPSPSRPSSPRPHSSRQVDAPDPDADTDMPKAPPRWLPVPKLVMAGFVLNLVFILVAVILSGLVLGGSLNVQAKAIGLTQSLVFFAAIFGLAYMALYAFAARKAEFAAGRRRGQTSALHTKAVIMGRITLVLWAVAALAVGITLAGERTAAASSLGPVRGDLAACIVNFIDMVVAELVVERAARPFVLPWLSPPIPESHASPAAKALIDDILDDGVSGQPHQAADAKATDKADAKPADAASPKAEAAAVPAAATPVEVSASPEKQAVSGPTPGQTIPEPYLAHIQELWSRVDDADRLYRPHGLTPSPHPPPVLHGLYSYPPSPYAPHPYAPPPYPPYAYPPAAYPPATPPPVAPLLQPTSAPPPPQSQPPPHPQPQPAVPPPSHGPVPLGSRQPPPPAQPQPSPPRTSYVSPMQNTPWPNPLFAGVRGAAARASSAGGDAPRFPPSASIVGPRPLVGQPPSAGGKKLFNRAAENLKGSGSREPAPEDWAGYQVPGSFV